jgi:hypothetical protein
MGDARLKGTAWLLLLAGALAAAVLWNAATYTVSTTRRIVGNGTGHYVRREDRLSTPLAASAAIALAAGGIAWGMLPGRARRNTALVAIGVVPALAMGGLVFYHTAAAGDGFHDFERYAGTREVVAAMGAGGIGCSRLEPAPPSRWSNGDALVCSTPTAADIRDGTDEVTIATWRDAGAREAWKEQFPTDSVYAVVGPTWLATCEFQSTCAGIQAAVGGRNH